MNDELRNILGDELFDELSEMSKNISENSIYDAEVLSEAEIAKIVDTVYMVQVPMGGTFALELMAALLHAHETDCESCWAEMNLFTISFIATMITTMLDDVKGKEIE